MEDYNHAGLDEASLTYATETETALDRLYAEDPALYVTAVYHLSFCDVPLDRTNAACAIVERALTRADDAADLARCCYLLAMLHARFLEPTDLVTAEEYLQQGLGVRRQPKTTTSTTS